MSQELLKLLFLSPAFPPFIGGGERYASALVTKLVDLGHEVTVVTSQAERERDLWLGSANTKRSEDHNVRMRIIRLPIRPMSGGRTGLLLWRKAMVTLSSLPGDQSERLATMAGKIPAVKGLTLELARSEEQFDLIHAFNITWEYPMVAGWRLAKERDIPLVLTPFGHFGTTDDDRVARNTSMDHQRRMACEAAAVLTLTDLERDSFVRLGTDPDKVMTVGSGLDSIPSYEVPEAVLERYQLTKPLALFIGRVNREKGALDTVAAIRQLRDQGLNLTLALIGQVSPEFEQLYSRLSPVEQNFIRPLGQVAETEKHSLLEAASMLVLPSESDSFGLVLLEAWAHRKPVIGARSGGIPGVIREGETGFLVDFGDVVALADRIERLQKDASLSQRLGDAGKKALEDRYNWDSVIEKVLAQYRKILSG